VNWMIVVGIVAVITVLVMVGQRKGWVDFSWNQKRRGGSMTIGDEVFAPTRYEAQVEMDRQTILPAPAPLPGDDDRGMHRGSIRIDVDGRGDRPRS
jgi:hypothetical protein